MVKCHLIRAMGVKAKAHIPSALKHGILKGVFTIDENPLIQSPSPGPGEHRNTISVNTRH